jgi:hypothetical protein
MFDSSTDAGGNIEGLHDQQGSPASLLDDEAKMIPDDSLEKNEAREIRRKDA